MPSASSEKRNKQKRSCKKRKLDDFNSSKCKYVSRKYCILQGKCSHMTDNCKGLKHWSTTTKKNKNTINPYTQGKKDLNTLIERQFQKFVKKKKGKIQKKSSNILSNYRCPMRRKLNRVSPVWKNVWKVEKLRPRTLDEK